MTDAESSLDVPSLPSWEDPPSDVPAAVRTIKSAIRARIEASGRSVEEVFGIVADLVSVRAGEIRAANEAAGTAWPVIDYADIAAGTVSTESYSLLRRRGCMVVRGHFDREQALGWDRQIVDYVDSNGFFENYRGPGDDFFGTVDSKPEIYPIYWSHAQMQARQSERMANVQRFLNSLWHNSSGGTEWFEPDRNVLYPDRIRRRPEGANSKGLGTHIDAGTFDLWMKAEYQQAFGHVFDGSIEQFDPWSAAHRTSGSQYPSTTMTSVFRTFQGWTALSDMDHDQGVLQAIPIPEAIAYLLLRPLLGDAADDDMCGMTAGQVFPVTQRWHAPLLEALSGIPDIRAGDSVWWHGDMPHAVAPVIDQRGWGNVMYIPAAPWCPRNEAYSASAFAALTAGTSPSDFPEEDYEQTWPNRFQIHELNQYGRLSLGLN
jgi:hypothetical protein